MSGEDLLGSFGSFIGGLTSLSAVLDVTYVVPTIQILRLMRH